MATLIDTSGTVVFNGTVDFGPQPTDSPIFQGGALTADLHVGVANGPNLPGRIPQLDAGGGTGGSVALIAGEGVSVGAVGGQATLTGGDSAAGHTGAQFVAGGGTATEKGAALVSAFLLKFGLANAAPADAALAAGDFALWLDATDGAGKLMVKAKTANGTVATAAINLT